MDKWQSETVNSIERELVTLRQGDTLEANLVGSDMDTVEYVFLRQDEELLSERESVDWSGFFATTGADPITVSIWLDGECEASDEAHAHVMYRGDETIRRLDSIEA